MNAWDVGRFVVVDEDDDGEAVGTMHGDHEDQQPIKMG